MQEPETISTLDFFRQFPDEETARKFFENRRWGGEPICGHCGSKSVTECKDHQPMAYRCRDCRAHFSVRTGTILAESRLPLLKWLLAIYMLTSAHKGIPCAQMARELGITQKSAWFLAQRIRETWLKDRDDNMNGQLEVKKNHMGVRGKNHPVDKRSNPSSDAVGKHDFVGIRDHNDEIHSNHVADTTDLSLTNFVFECANVDANLVTYQILACWTTLKRAYYGIYHYISVKHLHCHVKGLGSPYNIPQFGTV